MCMPAIPYVKLHEVFLSLYLPVSNEILYVYKMEYYMSIEVNELVIHAMVWHG